MKYKTVFILLTLHAHWVAAQNKSEETSSGSPSSSYFTLFEGGYGFHSGATGLSLAGSKHYQGTLARESEASLFSLHLYAQFQYLNDNVVFSTGSIPVKLFTLKAGLGWNTYMFTESNQAPFIGFRAFISRGSAQLVDAPAELSNYFRPVLWGYEVSTGIDFKRASSVNFAPNLRLRISWINEQGKFANIANFVSQAFVLSLGLAF